MNIFKVLKQKQSQLKFSYPKKTFFVYEAKMKISSDK